MRTVLCILICTLAMATAGVGQTVDDQTPATREDVERYLQAIHSHDMMKQMVRAMSAPMHKLIHEQFEKDKDKLPADFEARMQKFMDDSLNEMPFDEMMQAMIPAYQKHFSKGDINSLVAFYGSPTGQKVLRELPAIMAEAMEAMTPIMRKQMDAMNDRMQKEVAAMIRNGQKTSTTHPSVRN
jgi:uncharacterized protein